MSDKYGKYEITGLTHERCPFLRRIRALRPVGADGQMEASAAGKAGG